MERQSVFITSLVAIISIAVFLMILKFISKKQKIDLGLETQINISYSIWVSAYLLSFVFFLKVALSLIENAIETLINSKTDENTFLAIMEKITVFIGFTFIFTFFSYYLISFLIKIFLGKREIKTEIESNNIGFFIINGFAFILFTYSIVSVFEHFLSWFSPIVTTPFYH